MDSDDISQPTRFEKQLNFLEENPNYVAIGCRVDLIDEFGEVIDGHYFKFFKGNKKIRSALKYRMPLCHPALMFRTKTLLANSGYMYGNTSEDHELYLRMARNPDNLFENLSENLHSYRKHSNQLSGYANSFNAYVNIAGFLFTEFLRTWNPIYVIGIVANNPILRKWRNKIREYNRRYANL
jgi:hypothetical protein